MKHDFVEFHCGLYYFFCYKFYYINEEVLIHFQIFLYQNHLFSFSSYFSTFQFNSREILLKD